MRVTGIEVRLDIPLIASVFDSRFDYYIDPPTGQITRVPLGGSNGWLESCVGLAHCYPAALGLSVGILPAKTCNTPSGHISTPVTCHGLVWVIGPEAVRRKPNLI